MNKLASLFARKKNPVPFVDGEPVPWGDPEFSERLLRIHIAQETDMATRSGYRVQGEIGFLDGCFRTHLSKNRNRILDLMCGPGLYAKELGRRGYQVAGVDISPASIAFARKMIKQSRMSIPFHQANVLDVELPPESFDGCFWNYGAPNAFQHEDLIRMLNRIAEWLAPGGVLVTEMMSLDALAEECDKQWETLDKSYFYDRPHLWLDEKIWHEPTQSQLYRVYIVDAETGETTTFTEHHQGYAVDEYEEMLGLAGFDIRDRFGSMTGEILDDESRWVIHVAVKRGA